MFKFEKLLRYNDYDENNPELERVIARQIQKLRNLQKSITPDMPIDEKEKLEDKLDEIDNKIMELLPEFFDILDEEEENAKQAEAAKKQKEAAQKAEKEAKQKEDADKAEKDKEAKQKAEDAKIEQGDDAAVHKLYRAGKIKVDKAQLTQAGFDTGIFTDLTATGCKTKNYILKRENTNQPYYDIIKR